MYAAGAERKSEDVHDRTTQGSKNTVKILKYGVVVYIDSCAQDNSCSALESKVFVEHRNSTRLETNTIIDGGNHHHKVEAIATMYAYVAGEKIRIDGIPLVPTLEPNVLSHGRLKESGVGIRLDATRE